MAANKKKTSKKAEAAPVEAKPAPVEEVKAEKNKNQI